MDKAAFAHQELLRHNPKRHLHADMDSHLRLSAAYHCEEALWTEAESSYYLKFHRTDSLQKR